MSNPIEVTIINQIALNERAIAGVKNSYDFAQNPDNLAISQLPAVVHYIPSFDMTLRAHHNLWRTDFEVKSLLMVMPREGQGGKLKFLENSAIPFGYKWRDRFQTESVISGMLSSVGGVKCFLKSGNYGAGGELNYAGVDFIGWSFVYTISSA